MKKPSPAIGIIGGSGLSEMEGLSRRREIKVSTPFGPPSDTVLEGWVENRRVLFLPRHGKGHRILPSEINFRANIFAMKKLGVERIIAVSAVGSMKEGIAPGDFVIVDQFFDRTEGRAGTFFGRGIVAHVSLADPVCPELCAILDKESRALGIRTHRSGTYLCMQGPQFSTRAESKVYRQWGVDVIGMTNLQEAKLAREAEICYSSVATVTDYDSWREGHEAVTVEAVIRVMKSNSDKATKLIRRAISRLAQPRRCACKDALAMAIMTQPEKIPQKTVKELGPIVERYIHK